MSQIRIQRDAQMQSRFTIFGARIGYADGLNAPKSQAAQQPGQAPSAPKFSSVIFVPETAQEVLQSVQAVMWELVQKEFGQTAQMVWQELAASNKLALRSGATKASQEGFLGNFFINANAKPERPPGLFHKYLKPDGSGVVELSRPQSVIYSGCYVNVQLNLWVQNNAHGKRVNAELLAVQFADDGDAFGGGASADTSVFGGVAAPSPAGFGAPQQPATPGFGAPAAAPGFGAPAAAPGFGAPAAAPGFGAPNMGAFGAPAAAPGFGAPVAAPGFGAPQQFAAPQGTPNMGAFGAPPVM
jgi:hypothetical protein